MVKSQLINLSNQNQLKTARARKLSLLLKNQYPSLRMYFALPPRYALIERLCLDANLSIRLSIITCSFMELRWLGLRCENVHPHLISISRFSLFVVLDFKGIFLVELKAFVCVQKRATCSFLHTNNTGIVCVPFDFSRLSADNRMIFGKWKGLERGFFLRLGFRLGLGRIRRKYVKTDIFVWVFNLIF